MEASVADSTLLLEVFAALFEESREQVRRDLLERARVRLRALGEGSDLALRAYELGVLDALRFLEDTGVTLERALERVNEVQ